jgi:acyl-coenzyme A thioesterase PaaI-like protein
LHLLVRDPAAGGSFEEWPARLDAAGLHFTQSHPPARRLEVRFLLPGAAAEVRAEAEVVRVDRQGDAFVAHARLDRLSPEDALAVSRHLEDA